MSRWGEWHSYESTTRRPAKNGIKTRSQSGKIGETWWSERFIDLLESFGMGARLTRGRSYARSGQVMDLEVTSGVVKARVQGSRASPYRVEIRLKPLRDEEWDRALAAMAEQSLFAARLLAGEMPQEIEQAFGAAGASLFPASQQELDTECSCPDWANPCKHIAAVFFILAESFDQDPFRIFALRGRTKEQVIEKLRGMRSQSAGVDESPVPSAVVPQKVSPPLESCLDGFWSAGERLSELRVRLEAAEVPDVVLRQLGPAPVSIGKANLVDLLSPAYAEIARRAAELVPTAERDQ